MTPLGGKAPFVLIVPRFPNCLYTLRWRTPDKNLMLGSTVWLWQDGFDAPRRFPLVFIPILHSEGQCFQTQQKKQARLASVLLRTSRQCSRTAFLSLSDIFNALFVLQPRDGFLDAESGQSRARVLVPAFLHQLPHTTSTL